MHQDQEHKNSQTDARTEGMPQDQEPGSQQHSEKPAEGDAEDIDRDLELQEQRREGKTDNRRARKK